MTAAGVLVVGYGNSLRGDDGVGWHAARRLAADPRLDGTRVLARHQLTPELAEEMSRASLVVLVDASADGDPGSVSVRPVEPRPAIVVARVVAGAASGPGGSGSGGPTASEGAERRLG